MNEKWINRFLALALHIAQWSKDPSTKVGAVLVEANTNRVLSLGFNGPPRYINDDFWAWGDRDRKLACTLHAEENALLFANQTRGEVLFVTHHPCPKCMAALIQAGVSSVYCYYHSHGHFEKRWKDQIEMAAEMAEEVQLRIYKVTP